MKKNIIIISIILLISISLGAWWYQSSKREDPVESTPERTLEYWDRSRLSCSPDNELETLTILTSSRLRTNLRDLCTTFETQGIFIENIGDFKQLAKAEEDFQKSMKYGYGKQTIYLNQDVVIAVKDDSSEIVEVAIGEGLTQLMLWDFTAEDLINTLGNNRLNYEYTNAEVPFVQYVYPEKGLMFLAYKESGIMISLSFFAPTTQEEYLRFNQLGSDNQLLQKYSYNARG